MRIAITDIYGRLYEQDKLFDTKSCKIGENLLLPIIALKEELEKEGHQFHTLDMYNLNDVDEILFQEIPDSIFSTSNILEWVKQITKCILGRDKLFWAKIHLPIEKRVLIVMEPPVVAEKSYNKNIHRLFGKILTWDDNLVDGKKYFKFFYPQPIPTSRPSIAFSQKKMFVMMNANKSSNHPDELYSARKQIVEEFEELEEQFDLFGFGWENENYKNYRGVSERKLQTLARYRFVICFENQRNVKGYITEKIFDCFFAGCVPIYWGAENVTKYIPAETFIDWRNYTNLSNLIEYVKTIDEKQYNIFLQNANDFLQSRRFSDYFSVEAYVDNLKHVLLN